MAPCFGAGFLATSAHEAMLTDLDWLGPNLNGKKHDDPEAEGPSCDAIP